MNVEGNLIYRVGGTDVSVADGGTGASTHTADAVLTGNSTSAIVLETRITAPSVILTVSNGSTRRNSTNSRSH